eukprot:4544799-Pleurochrysis_carterae.AAC.1
MHEAKAPDSSPCASTAFCIQVNDISAGTFDNAMLPTVAELGVPIVLMHTRGLPTEMMARAHYKGDVVSAVCDELAVQTSAAAAAGIPPWMVLVDPGIGFAKQSQHSLALLRGLPRFVDRFCGRGHVHATATLVGASRKGFIGKVLGQPDPLRRQWGNAATVCAATAAGADVVRVHEVPEMEQVAQMSDAIYRSKL